MSTDADDVNAKINGLVSLLKAVGVDGGPNKTGKNLDEAQIQNIIRKLQTAQAEAPQIIAALEAHAKSKKGFSAPQQQPPPPQQEDGDYELEEEDDDDDDANYPMVGPGCSDDISVVSDLTTPTVVSSLNVPEEEQYKDTLPPMIVGSMLIAPTKRKNLVNAPRGMPRKSAPTGGAAAQRRKHYNATMEKLGDSKTPQKPSKPSQPTPKHKSHQKVGRRASTGAGNENWGDGWNAFDAPPKKSSPSTLIDDNGFLMNDANNTSGFADAFNPFQEDPFAQSTKKSSKKNKEKSSLNKSKASVGSSGSGKRRQRRASLAM